MTIQLVNKEDVIVRRLNGELSNKIYRSGRNNLTNKEKARRKYMNQTNI